MRVLKKFLESVLHKKDGKIVGIIVNKRRFFNYLKNRYPNCQRDVFLSSGDRPTRVVYRDMTLDGLVTMETLFSNSELVELFSTIIGISLESIQLNRMDEELLHFDVITSE